jgi:hypothetical protein
MAKRSAADAMPNVSTTARTTADRERVGNNSSVDLAVILADRRVERQSSVGRRDHRYTGGSVSLVQSLSER